MASTFGRKCRPVLRDDHDPPIRATTCEDAVTGCWVLTRGGIVFDIELDIGRPAVVDKEPTPSELLARAIEGMPSADRTRVVTWLLGRSWPARPVGGDLLAATRQAMAGSITMLSAEDPTALLSRQPVRRGEHQVVPIRLPAEQHAVLRDWCQEHNFTMATVVRGLVERFLEERGLLRRGAAEET
jgi:hypothetical protein